MGPTLGFIALAAAITLAACGDNGTVTADAAGVDAPLDAAVIDAPPDATVAGDCDPAGLPMNRAAPLACCANGNDEWFIGNNAPMIGILVHRVHGVACTTDGVTGGCTGMACAYGPCGARIVETFPAPAYVFRPMSDPTVCGRQAEGLAGVPEAYTPAHMSYPPATPACPFTSCSAEGPRVTLTVTSTATGATGRVTSTPAGVDVAGAGMAAFAFGQTAVTLTATPMGAHARAIFSGACTVTGQVGMAATCSLILGPDKTVMVTYECEGGETCQP
jgi:hypothetical protein